MAYLGEGKVKLNPNHPLAHSQISFGMKRLGSSSSASEKPKAESSSNQPPPEPSLDSTPSV